jgi:hypothetical protein
MKSDTERDHMFYSGLIQTPQPLGAQFTAGTQFMPGTPFMPGAPFMPGNQFMPQMPPVPGVGTPNLGQLENRVSVLERQIKRMEVRLSKLETPFTTTTPGVPPTGFQPTQMQTDPFAQPYQTSMQMM